MRREFQKISSTDLYFICQVVDKVIREPFPYLRNLESVFGDASSRLLSVAFPKWTSLHNFIEFAISGMIFEEASEKKPVGEFWVDHLCVSTSLEEYAQNAEQINRLKCDGSVEGYEYFEFLADNGILDRICEDVTKQVFYVLFSNRGTLAAFWGLASDYVSSVAPSFEPDSFTKSGSLKRARVPTWAKDAIFHRDKGRCVVCTINLTRLINQESSLHYDHIVPLANGGGNCVTNLQLLCSVCNTKKGARSSTTSRDYEAWFNYDI